MRAGEVAPFLPPSSSSDRGVLMRRPPPHSLSSPRKGRLRFTRFGVPGLSPFQFLLPRPPNFRPRTPHHHLWSMVEAGNMLALSHSKAGSRAGDLPAHCPQCPALAPAVGGPSLSHVEPQDVWVQGGPGEQVCGLLPHHRAATLKCLRPPTGPPRIIG